MQDIQDEVSRLAQRTGYMLKRLLSLTLIIMARQLIAQSLQCVVFNPKNMTVWLVITFML